MDKKESYFSNGEVRVISSSHNDIAFLDTPLATIVFRNKNVIGKAITMIEEDPNFRHTIEDSLYIKDFLILNQNQKERLSKVMIDNKLACGATYTQLYESSVNSEGLVRQYYLGKRWLEKEFPGFITRTTWNQDVPARAMQSAQIMKKCGVDYLFISRMNAGFFKWYSPDGSFVSGYSTGHYHQNSISNIINIEYDAYNEDERKSSMEGKKEESLTYDKKGHQKIFDYMEESAKSTYEKNNIPPYFGFLAVRDYDYPLNLDKYFESLDKDKEIHFPKFANATAEEFMDKAVKILNKKSYWKEYYGERPNLWIYHEITHSKAFYYNRIGLNTIDEVEILASLQLLLKTKNSYPTKEINKVWEQLLYLDHGWGGYNGHVTDETYLQVSKKGFISSKNLLEKQLENLSSLIKIENDGSYITIFNVSAWRRNDRVVRLVNWQELGTLDFEILDSKDRPVEYQIIEEPAPYTIKIMFMADVPALGFVRYRIIKKAKRELNKSVDYKVEIESKHKLIIDNKFYHLILEDGGFIEMFDKELKENILDENNLLKGFEIFMLDSSGNGSGEFSEIQQPNKTYGLAVDKFGSSTGYNNSASNYNMSWSLKNHEGLNQPQGNVVTIIEGRAKFPHFTLIQQIFVYNKMKKIETKVNIEAWDGTLYREIRMALPLNKRYKNLSYEVPMGILKHGIDEVNGPIGTKPFVKNIKENFPTVIYPTPCEEIHPREVQSWIGVESVDSTVFLSCVETPTFDFVNFINPKNRFESECLNIQPILLASRHSCFMEGGNPYEQRGNHSASFCFTSKPGSLKENVKAIEGEKHQFSSTIIYDGKEHNGLPKAFSFIKISGDIRISGIKKAEDTNDIVVRVYEPFGIRQEIMIDLFNKIKSVRKSNMLEYGGKIIKKDKIEDLITPYSIETYCLEI